MTKRRCIFSQKLMAYLVLHGYPLRGVGRDKRDDRFMVFYFDEDDSLDSVIQKYKESNENSKENNNDQRERTIN